MATNNFKRASALLRQRKAEWQRQFKACHGNAKAVQRAAKDYHKKYGATPATRWKRALRDAKHVNRDTQTALRLR